MDTWLNNYGWQGEQNKNGEIEVWWCYPCIDWFGNLFARYVGNSSGNFLSSSQLHPFSGPLSAWLIESMLKLVLGTWLIHQNLARRIFKHEEYFRPKRIFKRDKTFSFNFPPRFFQAYVVGWSSLQFKNSPPRMKLLINFTISTDKNKLIIVGCDSYGHVSGSYNAELLTRLGLGKRHYSRRQSHSVGSTLTYFHHDIKGSYLAVTWLQYDWLITVCVD